MQFGVQGNPGRHDKLDNHNDIDEGDNNPCVQGNRIKFYQYSRSLIYHANPTSELPPRLHAVSLSYVMNTSRTLRVFIFTLFLCDWPDKLGKMPLKRAHPWRTGAEN